MNKTFAILLTIFFFFISDNLYSQSVKVLEIRSGKQLVNGLNLAPKSNDLQKASPSEITQNQLSNEKVVPKPPVKVKPTKVSKYNNGKAKRDED